MNLDSPKSLSRTVFWVMASLVMVGLVALPLLAWSMRRGAPVQPMRFSHKAHFEESTCEGCHLYVMEHSSAGEPRLADCLDCHDGPQSENPEDLKEEEKLEKYADANEEIPWVRLPRLTSDIYFSHRMHVALAEKQLECKNCHGDIGKSEILPMRREVAFTMDWCMDCHHERQASNDCLACHR